MHFVYFDYKNNYTALTSLTWTAQSDVTVTRLFKSVTCVSDKAEINKVRDKKVLKI